MVDYHSPSPRLSFNLESFKGAIPPLRIYHHELSRLAFTNKKSTWRHCQLIKMSPDVHRPQKLCRHQSHLCVLLSTLVTIFIATIRFAISVDKTPPERADSSHDCGRNDDPVFWQLVISIVFQNSLFLITLILIMNHLRGSINLNIVGFYGCVGVSVFAQTAGVIVYATACSSEALQTGVSLGSLANIMVHAALVQLLVSMGIK
ncbi:hypothetical protein BKA67DRAFT_694791 [Truncatella angustata]|uniref:Uncharacterized protein n=1 Tax=Truncatella angustata TaxID=152316 RepID=A0A9P8RKX9_9PEZI|nr:uncharacterized protein BKA67DRAFT_694791 [Truncatella angustata]KAH6647789.1 hypothetical protein BKA67DRAFT_694791 [Truncatella angustata]